MGKRSNIETRARETKHYYIIVAGWSNEPYEDGEVTSKQAKPMQMSITKQA